MRSPGPRPGSASWRFAQRSVGRVRTLQIWPDVIQRIRLLLMAVILASRPEDGLCRNLKQQHSVCRYLKFPLLWKRHLDFTSSSWRIGRIELYHPLTPSDRKSGLILFNPGFSKPFKRTPISSMIAGKSMYWINCRRKWFWHKPDSREAHHYSQFRACNVLKFSYLRIQPVSFLVESYSFAVKGSLACNLLARSRNGTTIACGVLIYRFVSACRNPQ